MDAELLFPDVIGDEISYPEYLVVRTWRKIAFSRGACPTLGMEFGPGDATDLVDAIALLLMALGRGSRHMLTVGHPGCFALTPDERQILAIIGASHAGDDTLLEPHLSWLVRKDCQDPVLEAARALARLLRLRGIRFPLPRLPGSPCNPILTVVRDPVHASIV